MDGFGFYPYEMDYLKRIRFFITKVLDKDGSFLDIGSSNGFLVKCLQAWCENDIEPFGIDKQERLIEQAKELFSECPGNFQKVDLWNVVKNGSRELEDAGMPRQYDLVYWNVWDECSLVIPLEHRIITRLLELCKPEGRLILAFYRPESGDNSKNKAKVGKLKNAGFKIAGTLENDDDDVIAWIDKN